MQKTTERTFNFTDAALRKLPIPPKPQQNDYFDTGTRGLGIRVSYGGTKSFFLMFSSDGVRQRLSLGQYGQLEQNKLSLAEARKAARAKLGEVATGKNPAGEARAQRQAPTIAEIAADWIEAQKRKGKTSWWRQEEILARDILPKIGTMRGRDIERRHVRALLLEITERPALVLANRAQEIGRALTNWALRRGDYGLEYNAWEHHDRNVEHKGEAWLTLEQLGAYWNALDQERSGPAAGLRLGLLLAQRQQNILGMHRDQLALEDRLWIIPGSLMKAGQDHTVPLSMTAVAVIEERLAAIPAAQQYLFPCKGRPGPATLTFLAKPHRRVCARAGIQNYPPHAHRRSFGRHCDMMGISRLVWDGILGHSNGSMADLYSGHDFADQRLDCMKLWSQRIAAAASDNVVQLENKLA